MAVIDNKNNASKMLLTKSTKGATHARKGYFAAEGGTSGSERSSSRPKGGLEGSLSACVACGDCRFTTAKKNKQA